MEIIDNLYLNNIVLKQYKSRIGNISLYYVIHLTTSA